MSSFAYIVSDATRRREVTENEAILSQLDALDALGALDWPEWVGDSLDLAVASSANLTAVSNLLGWTEEDALCLLAYTDVAPERVGRPDNAFENLPRGWYERGRSALAALEARLGHAVYTPAERPKQRATARRRLRTAKQSLKQR